MKLNLEQLNEINNVVAELYQKDEHLKQGKFGYAYNKFYQKNTQVILDELKEAITISNINNALEDEKTKALITDEKGNYQYSKEGKIALLKEQKAIVEEYYKKEIELTLYLSPVKPEMTEEQYEVLKGVIVE